MAGRKSRRRASNGSGYYESGNMPERSMGRQKAKKIPRGMLGTGMAEGAANKLRARRRLLESL